MPTFELADTIYTLSPNFLLSLAMKKFQLIYEIHGKKFRTTIYANSEIEADEKLSNFIIKSFKVVSIEIIGGAKERSPEVLEMAKNLFEWK